MLREGGAAVICLFRLCRFCCGRQSRRQSVKWGSGAREASKGATLLVIIPMGQALPQGYACGSAVLVLPNFLGEGFVPLGMSRGAMGWVLPMQDLPCMTEWRRSVWRSK